MSLNESTLNWIEEIGGGYVWDAEVTAINLLEVEVSSEDAARLRCLIGVQQIAINASVLSIEAIRGLAQIPGLSSLVLANSSLPPEAQQELQGVGLNLQLV